MLSRTPRANLNRLLEAIKPKLYEESPTARWRAFVFQRVKHVKFDQTIMVVILLNTLFMALEHYGQSQTCVPSACVNVRSFVFLRFASDYVSRI